MAITRKKLGVRKGLFSLLVVFTVILPLFSSAVSAASWGAGGEGKVDVDLQPHKTVMRKGDLVTLNDISILSENSTHYLVQTNSENKEIHKDWVESVNETAISYRPPGKPVNEYRIDIQNQEITSTYSNGEPKDVKITFTVKPNQITHILDENRLQDFKDHYYFKQKEINQTEFNELKKEIKEIPVKSIQKGDLTDTKTRPITPPDSGGRDWIEQGESNQVTFTATLTQENPSFAEARFVTGNHSVTWSVSSQTNWLSYMSSQEYIDVVNGNTKIERALDFDGSDDALKTDITNNYNQATIEILFKVNSLPPSGETKKLFARSSSRPYLQVLDSGQIEFDCYDGSNHNMVTSNTAINAGEWYWATLTLGSSDGMQIFINGSFDASNSYTGTYEYNNGEEIAIGAVTDWQNSLKSYYDVEIAKFRYWTYVMSDTEISNKVDTILGGGETDLLSLFRMDEGSGGDTYDYARDSNYGFNDQPTWFGTDTSGTWTSVIHDMNTSNKQSIDSANFTSIIGTNEDVDVRIGVDTDDDGVIEKTSSWVSLSDGTNSLSASDFDIDTSGYRYQVGFNLSVSDGDTSHSPSVNDFGVSTTEANNLPNVSNPSPSGGTVLGSTDSILSVDLSDTDGDSMDAWFFNANNNEQIGSKQTGIDSGGSASVSWTGLEANTTYNWYLNVSDGKSNYTSDTFTFEVGLGINLTFKDSSIVEDGFNVYTNSSGTWKKVHSFQSSNTGGTGQRNTNFIDKDLDKGERACYRVAAFNEAGESEKSGKACLSP